MSRPDDLPAASRQEPSDVPLWVRLWENQQAERHSTAVSLLADEPAWVRLQQGDLAALPDVLRAAPDASVLDHRAVVAALQALYTAARSGITTEAREADTILRRVGAAMGGRRGRPRATSPEHFARLYNSLKRGADEITRWDRRLRDGSPPTIKEEASRRLRPRTFPAWDHSLGLRRFALSERQSIWQRALQGAWLPGARGTPPATDPGAKALARFHGPAPASDQIPVFRLTWHGLAQRDSNTVASYRLNDAADPAYETLKEPITNVLDYEVVLTKEHIEKLRARQLAPSRWAMEAAKGVFAVGEERARQLLRKGRKRSGTPARDSGARPQAVADLHRTQ